MKKLSITILCAAILGLAGAAVAKVDKKLLLGKWKGEMQMSMSGTDHKEKVAMEFKRDGTLYITSGDHDKVEKGTYQLRGNDIALIDSKTKDEIILTDITLSKSRLSGTLKPGDGAGIPDGVVITMVLERAR